MRRRSYGVENLKSEVLELGALYQVSCLQISDMQ